MLLFLSSIIITIVYNKSEFVESDANPCTTISELPLDKPTILFSAGGGYWPYYLGVAKYIKENYELSDVTIVGTSAGALPVLALTQPSEMDDVMNESLNLVDEISKYWTGVFSFQWSTLYKKSILKFLSNDYTTNTNSFIAVSKFTPFGLQKQYFMADSNSHAITDTAVASSWLPFLTAPFFQPLLRIGDSYYLDGFWTGKDKINKDNSIVIYPDRFGKLPLFTYWLWLGRDYNFKLYNLGYEHASKNNNVFSILPKLI
jgi:hypothetical protein